ncbi:MAG: Uncharacterised protein [Formosa sp. Hel1_33_131]|nr:MAG: Uncharacterised protein [Formosa sp. Hel1_33_131]
MENYYDKSNRWVYDTDGNFLHSKRMNYNPNIIREEMFVSNSKVDDEQYFEYLYRKENKL